MRYSYDTASPGVVGSYMKGFDIQGRLTCIWMADLVVYIAARSINVLLFNVYIRMECSS